MRHWIIAVLAPVALAGCHAGKQPPENRCAMYWDYYYNAGLGKSPDQRQKAEGVNFSDIRSIIKADVSAKTKVCQRILKDAFPDDPVLQRVREPIPPAQ